MNVETISIDAKKHVLDQRVNMPVMIKSLSILTWESMGTDFLLESSEALQFLASFVRPGAATWFFSQHHVW